MVVFATQQLCYIISCLRSIGASTSKEKRMLHPDCVFPISRKMEEHFPVDMVEYRTEGGTDVWTGLRQKLSERWVVTYSWVWKFRLWVSVEENGHAVRYMASIETGRSNKEYTRSITNTSGELRKFFEDFLRGVPA